MGLSSKRDHENYIVVTAPHGGYIEYNTAKQAKYATEIQDAAGWICLGYSDGSGAFDRWHITSTNIAPDSFQKPARLAKREFAYAISFHGFIKSGIAIGGRIEREI